MTGLTAPPSIPQAYRLLLRGLLKAVKYSKPARFTVRDRLRSSFRHGGPKVNPFFPSLRLPASPEEQERHPEPTVGSWAVVEAEGAGPDGTRAEPPRQDKLDLTRFNRTLELLDGAARCHGPEHKLLRSLVMYWGVRGYRRHTGHTFRFEVSRTILDDRVDEYLNHLERSMNIYVGKS